MKKSVINIICTLEQHKSKSITLWIYRVSVYHILIQFVSRFKLVISFIHVYTRLELYYIFILKRILFLLDFNIVHQSI